MTDRAHELERLRSRLGDLEAAHDRERARREQSERQLEDERTEALRLRSEAGRLGAELDLVRATRDELDAASAELETIRGEALSTGQELEATRVELTHTIRQLKDAREHGRDAGRALEAARSEALQSGRRLHETRHQLEALERERESVTFALEQEQAESARLRRELADSEDAVRRLAGARSGTVSRARTVVEEGDSGPARPAEASESDSLFSPRTPPVEHRLEPMSPRLRALNKLESSTPAWTDRPLNPSLRSPGNWALRALAVVVVLIVLAAVVVLINSTVA
jgi:chromosome segregation ATPase